MCTFSRLHCLKKSLRPTHAKLHTSNLLRRTKAATRSQNKLATTNKHITLAENIALMSPLALGALQSQHIVRANLLVAAETEGFLTEVLVHPIHRGSQASQKHRASLAVGRGGVVQQLAQAAPPTFNRIEVGGALRVILQHVEAGLGERL